MNTKNKEVLTHAKISKNMKSTAKLGLVVLISLPTSSEIHVKNMYRKAIAQKKVSTPVTESSYSKNYQE